MNTPLHAAVLVVSETASRDPATDKCVPALREVLQKASTESIEWSVKDTLIVSDDVLAIQRAIIRWTDPADPVNLIVTSGGTGFTGKDVTPEAVSPLLHKHAPGLVHGMLAASLTVTPFAMMARPVAGVRNKTLILTLPGSPKGAKENLEAVIKLLAHACQQVAGADSRSLHAGGTKRLEREAGVASTAHNDKQAHTHDHSHHHHHGHHGHNAPKPHTNPAERPQPSDSSASPANRHRSSPYPMISVVEALDLISKHTPGPTTITAPLSSALINSVLASDVHARESVPAYRASIVDGYAVPHPCAAGSYPVSTISHATATTATSSLAPGTIARITTGAPLPSNADSVIMVEDTRLLSATPDGKEEATVEILTSAVQKGENVREVGSDVAAGSLVLSAGEALSATGGEYALLASVGTRSLTIYRRPVVGVLSTGDELIPAESAQPLLRGQVRDTNRPSLLAAAKNMAFESIDLGIAPDTPDGLEEKLRESLARCDVLVTSGGVSMGELDLLKPMLTHRLGGDVHFGRVGMKPGKPSTFATVEVKDGTERKKKAVFALPGNPASALVTFHLFVLPALQKLAGQVPANGLPRVKVRMGERTACDKARQEYVRAVVCATDRGLVARSTGGQRSSRVGSFRGANALLEMPVGGKGVVEEGDEVVALMMGPLVSTLRT